MVRQTASKNKLDKAKDVSCKQDSGTADNKGLDLSQTELKRDF